MVVYNYIKGGAMKESDIRKIVFETLETHLELQLRAIRQMIGTEELPPPVRIKRGLRKDSLVDLSVRVLEDEGGPMHVEQIREELLKKFGRVTERDSLQSSLGKKAKSGELFAMKGDGVFELMRKGKGK
ncbi:MAG: hypothetical protein WAX69_00940 [Victivallales bacterium]